MLKKFLADESGATAIEYGLIAALISISVIAGFVAIGEGLNKHWQDTATAVSGAGASYLPE